MPAWLQVRKETWVPLDLQDLLEDREPQEDPVLLDLKVLTHSILTTKIMYDNTYCYKLTYAARIQHASSVQHHQNISRMIIFPTAKNLFKTLGSGCISYEK